METWGAIVNQDGVLHYIIDVQGTLVRRHVDQICPVGNEVQANILPIIHQRFPSAEVRETTQTFSMQKQRRYISKDLNKELGSCAVPEVPSTDDTVPDVSPSSA
ncbi:hypothetical protein TNCT_96181 [Trichonephila clavata]|uniref:Uncharacterized protein n=1 Tax=Trichonephila clavata TaxID=2740835 RepID=A0A8X6FLM3_TRICU|nr:hypothetical protein TNCT_96181 [Trichonephila clavata]